MQVYKIRFYCDESRLFSLQVLCFISNRSALSNISCQRLTKVKIMLQLKQPFKCHIHFSDNYLKLAEK